MLRRALPASVAMLLLAAGSAFADEPEETDFGRVGGYAGLAASHMVNNGKSDPGDESPGASGEDQQGADGQRGERGPGSRRLRQQPRHPSAR